VRTAPARRHPIKLAKCLGARADPKVRNRKERGNFIDDLVSLAHDGYRHWQALFVEVGGLLRVTGDPESRVSRTEFAYPWATVYDIPLNIYEGVQHDRCPRFADWDGETPIVEYLNVGENDDVPASQIITWHLADRSSPDHWSSRGGAVLGRVKTNDVLHDVVLVIHHPRSGLERLRTAGGAFVNRAQIQKQRGRQLRQPEVSSELALE
jgi:hypothetical protein